MKIVKIGNVELTEAEAFKLYESGKYIVTYNTISDTAEDVINTYGQEIPETISQRCESFITSYPKNRNG